eukprot:gene30369-27847_t
MPSSRVTRAALLSLSHSLPSAELREVQRVFAAFDRDGTGTVSRDVW